MSNPRHLNKKYLVINPVERGRLAAWLSTLERIRTINLGRWYQLCDGLTDYVSHRELAELMDCAPPVGFAIDIVRGDCIVSELVDPDWEAIRIQMMDEDIGGIIDLDEEQRFQEEIDEAMNATPCTCKTWRDIDGTHHEEDCEKMKVFFVGMGVR